MCSCAGTVGAAVVTKEAASYKYIFYTIGLAQSKVAVTAFYSLLLHSVTLLTVLCAQQPAIACSHLLLIVAIGIAHAMAGPTMLCIRPLHYIVLSRRTGVGG